LAFFRKNPAEPVSLTACQMRGTRLLKLIACVPTCSPKLTWPR
jgi:hypothetical protein